MFEGRASVFARSRRLSHALPREQEAGPVHYVRLVVSILLTTITIKRLLLLGNYYYYYYINRTKST